MARPRRLRDSDYERLLEFRSGLRKFLKWSKDQAANAGLAPTQHQLMLAIRGHHDHERGPTIGEVAQYLLIRPHTAAELVNRASGAGMVERLEDRDDARIVRLRLTALGAEKLESITGATLEELNRLRPRLRRVWEGLESEVQR